jgi:hypothetical protein
VTPSSLQDKVVFLKAARIASPGKSTILKSEEVVYKIVDEHVEADKKEAYRQINSQDRVLDLTTISTLTGRVDIEY